MHSSVVIIANKNCYHLVFSVCPFRWDSSRSTLLACFVIIDLLHQLRFHCSTLGSRFPSLKVECYIHCYYYCYYCSLVHSHLRMAQADSNNQVHFHFGYYCCFAISEQECLSCSGVFSSYRHCSKPSHQRVDNVISRLAYSWMTQFYLNCSRESLSYLRKALARFYLINGTWSHDVFASISSSKEVVCQPDVNSSSRVWALHRCRHCCRCQLSSSYYYYLLTRIPGAFSSWIQWLNSYGNAAVMWLSFEFQVGILWQCVDRWFHRCLFCRCTRGTDLSGRWRFLCRRWTRHLKSRLKEDSLSRI